MVRCFFFFFNDTATTEIYTLSLHDALPIFVAPSGLMPTCSTSNPPGVRSVARPPSTGTAYRCVQHVGMRDRKSTRLNSSHGYISYAVFCLKKKKNKHTIRTTAMYS